MACSNLLTTVSLLIMAFIFLIVAMSHGLECTNVVGDMSEQAKKYKID